MKQLLHKIKKRKIMKRFIISFVDVDGLMDMREVKANSDKEALVMYLKYVQGWTHEVWLDDTDITVEELRDCVQECECNIAYLEI